MEQGDAIDQLYFVCDGVLVWIQYLIIKLHVHQIKKKAPLSKIGVNVNLLFSIM